MMPCLVRDHSAGAYAVRVPCLAGDGMVQLSEAIIDANGPAFRAYYHTRCAPDGAVARCPRWDCARAVCTP